ncbi:hypothetical protein B0J17DRAFT_633590 [Rhizoctonia solani]|nr:hypothetical protein B0J17DRAFT_633590 [Rhizoctonia solani]
MDLASLLSLNLSTLILLNALVAGHILHTESFQKVWIGGPTTLRICERGRKNGRGGWRVLAGTRANLKVQPRFAKHTNLTGWVHTRKATTIKFTIISKCLIKEGANLEREIGKSSSVQIQPIRPQA